MKEQSVLSKRGILLPVVIFLIVAIAALTPFLIQHIETTNERANYLDEWNKIEWAVSGIKTKHLEKSVEKDFYAPYGNSTIATISYDNFHVSVSIIERKTMLDRNLCFGLIPQVYRGTEGDYVDAGYDLSEYTANTTSAPGVAAAGNHSFAWLTNGSLYSWGNNSKSQLGRSGSTSRPNLVDQGSLLTQDASHFNQGWLVAGAKETSIAVDYLGKVYGWGKLAEKLPFGFIPRWAKEDYVTAPVFLDDFGLRNVEALDISAGNDFVAVLDKNGEVHRLSWTDALGKTNNQFEKISHISGARGIAGGANHVLAITSNGDLWGYGSNEKHQLGRSNKALKGPLLINESEVGLVSEVPLGNSNLANPTVDAKFFISSVYNLATFTVVANAKARYEETPNVFATGNYYKDYIRLEDERGGYKRLDPTSVEQSGKHIWKFEDSQLEPGTYTVKLYTEHTRVEWVRAGFLGLEGYWEHTHYHEAINNRWYRNASTTAEIKNKGVYSFWGSPVLPTGFIGVAAGGDSSFALKKNLNDPNDKPVLYSWGANGSGQLGLGHTNDAQNMAPVPDFAGNDRLRSVSAGLTHALVLTEGGRVYSFGDNTYGQLGRTVNTTTSPKHTPKLVDNLYNIISIAAGDYHSLAMDEQFNVYSWGRNDFGQLGLGNTSNQSIPKLVNIGE